MSLAEIGVDGWRSINDPPETDRVVQLAWDDMSFSDSSLGFFDEVAQIPPTNRRIWWVLRPNIRPIPSENLGAWRDTAEGGAA